MYEKALVIGSGFLGSYIVDQLKKHNIATTGTYFSNFKENMIKLDIKDLDSLYKCFQKIKPDFVINCAAITNINYLEQNPDVAFKINSEGAKNISLIAKKMNAKLIHISTDGIFDGIKGMYTETDMPNPINIYAKSKVQGEEFVKDIMKNYIIVRTNFYGYNNEGKFLFNWILHELQNSKKITGFNDIIFTPLEISNLSEMIFELTQSNFNGIIHLASNDVISKYDFALSIAEIFELNQNLIKKGSSNDFKFTAKRPKNTSLNNSFAKKILKTKIISLNDCLQKIKAQI